MRRVMNKIGIIFAMKEEIDAFLKYFDLKNEYHLFELNFYEGFINNIECILVECGIGKVNASRTTQILIDNYDVDIIINVGVAGSVSDNLNVGDIVIGDKLVQHDFDITAFNHEKGYIPNVGKYLDADEYLLNLCQQIIVPNDYKVYRGVIASGDIFCSSEKMSNKIHDKFNALCVEMEGASIAQVCYLCNIPFLVLRSISDSNDNNHVNTYEEFLPISCERIAWYLNELILLIK